MPLVSVLRGNKSSVDDYPGSVGRDLTASIGDEVSFRKVKIQ